MVIKEAKRLDENSAECANSNTPPQHIQSETLLHVSNTLYSIDRMHYVDRPLPRL